VQQLRGGAQRARGATRARHGGAKYVNVAELHCDRFVAARLGRRSVDSWRTVVGGARGTEACAPRRCARRGVEVHYIIEGI
jgi:hypothetical protein